MRRPLSLTLPAVHANALAYALLILAVPALFLLPRLHVDNRLERWVHPEERDAQNYDRFRELFGNDEFIVAAISRDDLLTQPALDAAVQALETLEQLPAVVGVMGIPRVFRDQFGLEDAESLREEVMNSPYYERIFISEDAKTAGLLIQTGPSQGPGARAELVQSVADALQPLEDAGFDVRLVGPPVLNVDLDRLSRSETLRTFPIAVAASLVVLLVLLRSFRAMLVAFVSTALSLLLLLALIALTGVSLNMITTVLPVLVWVLALANIIHLLRRYQHFLAETTDRSAAVERARDEVAYPNVLSAVTTACGFVSLLMADMTPVRELGLFAAAGMLISLGVNLSVAPMLIRVFRVPRVKAPAMASVPWPMPHHARLVLLSSGILMALCVVGVTAIRVESNPISFFPRDHRIIQSYDRVQEKLAGFYSLEVVVHLPAVWTDPEIWPVVSQLQASLETSPLVPRVYSPLDLLRLLHQWDNDFDPAFYTFPESREAAEALIAELGEADRAELRRYVSEDGRVVRLSALVNEMNSGPFLAFIGETEDKLERLGGGYSAYATGIVRQLVAAQESLVHTQIKSLSLAVCFVFLVLLFGLRSIRLTLVSIVPNVLPILAAFAAMGALGIKLDAATVMVASVALGIAVDDTVHYLAAFHRETLRTHDTATAIRTALNEIAPSMTITTITAAVGFLALYSSQFIPIRHFGILSAVAVVAALLADLFMVPAMLALTFRSPKARDDRVH